MTLRPLPPQTFKAPPHHGGRLSAAQTAAPEISPPWHSGKWLDLSTGISPNTYPFTTPSEEKYRTLPDQKDVEYCLHAARQAYCLPQKADILSGNGSQHFIQILPQLARQTTSHQKVCIISPTYAEHAFHWFTAGFDVFQADIEDLPEICDSFDIVIIVNPNNPTGQYISTDNLLSYHHTLARRGGWLIIDEAFCDVMPEISLCPYAGSATLFILRSLGKFYGLAGIRLGFLVCAPRWRAKLTPLLGPWPVSTPTLLIGAQALLDISWQKTQIQKLHQHMTALHEICAACGFHYLGGTSLFLLYDIKDIENFKIFLRQNALIARFFSTHPTWVRLGLVPDFDQSLFQEKLWAHYKIKT